MSWPPLPEVVAWGDGVFGILVVKATEAVSRHAERSRFVKVAVPLDLQPHNATLQSPERGAQTGLLKALARQPKGLPDAGQATGLQTGFLPSV